MTLFKDPNSYNYAFYGAIIVLAVIGSLFFGEPASPEHLTNKIMSWPVHQNLWSAITQIQSLNY